MTNVTGDLNPINWSFAPVLKYRVETLLPVPATVMLPDALTPPVVSMRVLPPIVPVMMALPRTLPGVLMVARLLSSTLKSVISFEVTVLFHAREPREVVSGFWASPSVTNFLFTASPGKMGSGTLETADPIMSRGPVI